MAYPVHVALCDIIVIVIYRSERTHTKIRMDRVTF